MPRLLPFMESVVRTACAEKRLVVDKLVLIDGNSIVNRAFYGVPDLTNKEGFHTNAIYGFSSK